MMTLLNDYPNFTTLVPYSKFNDTIILRINLHNVSYITSGEVSEVSSKTNLAYADY